MPDFRAPIGVITSRGRRGVRDVLITELGGAKPSSAVSVSHPVAPGLCVQGDWAAARKSCPTPRAILVE